MAARACFDFFLEAADLPPDDLPTPTGPAMSRGPKVSEEDNRTKVPLKRKLKQQTQTVRDGKLSHAVATTMTQKRDATSIIHKPCESLSTSAKQLPQNKQVVAHTSCENDSIITPTLADSTACIVQQSSETNPVSANGQDHSESVSAIGEQSGVQTPGEIETVAAIAEQSGVQMSCGIEAAVAVDTTPRPKKRGKISDSSSITPPRIDIVPTSERVQITTSSTTASSTPSMQAKVALEEEVVQTPIARRRRLRRKTSLDGLGLLVADAQLVPHATLDELVTSQEMLIESESLECLAIVPYKRPARALSPKNRRDSRTPVQKNPFYESLRGTNLEEIILSPVEDLGGGRPKRRRMPPVEFWRGETVSYERLPGVNGLTMTAVVYNTAGGERNHQLAIMDKSRLPALRDKPRLKALKDKQKA